MTDETTGWPGSTVPRRQLGRNLRDLRLRARLSVRAAAEALQWSETKMWRIETGQTSLRPHDVELMCRIYGAPADRLPVLMKLAKDTKEPAAKGWWHSYDDVMPRTFDIFLGLEEEASHLSWFESELVPGLFQTADYARALIRNRNTSKTEEEIERLVQLRVSRQALLTRTTRRPDFDVVLNEAVLLRAVGGRAAMAEQLRWLAEVSDLPNVKLHVVPFSAGVHIGMDTNSFILLRFPRDVNGKESEPPIVYISGFTGDLYLDKTSEIERFGAAFGDLVGLALDTRASQSYILQAAREFER